MPVGLVAHSATLGHAPPYRGHPERPERIVALREHLDATGLAGDVDLHEPSPAPRQFAELVHSPRYLDALESLDAAGGGRIDMDTGMGPGSLEAALRATQGAIDAASRVLDGTWSSAFVATRPPGHHATPSRPMGFCLTNHVAIAARWVVTRGLCARVAIVDWDVHHGNGSQDAFWSDPDVLYISLHQYPWYPGSGDVTEVGEGPGRGSTLNVPLPAGAAEDAYLRAFREVVAPEVAAFDPGLIFVSAGYDAHHRDPLGMMRLTAGAFFRFAQAVAGWGPGPVCVLEGGYDLEALAWSAGATISALIGEDQPRGIPATEEKPASGSPEAQLWIDRARDVRERIRR